MLTDEQVDFLREYVRDIDPPPVRIEITNQPEPIKIPDFPKVEIPDTSAELARIAKTISDASRQASDSKTDMLVAEKTIAAIADASSLVAKAVMALKAFDGSAIVSAIKANTAALDRLAAAYESPKRFITDSRGEVIGAELGEPDDD